MNRNQTNDLRPEARLSFEKAQLLVQRLQCEARLVQEIKELGRTLKNKLIELRILRRQIIGMSPNPHRTRRPWSDNFFLKFECRPLRLAACTWLLAIVYWLCAPGALAQPALPKVPAAGPITNAPVETFPIKLAWDYDTAPPAWTVIQWYTNNAIGQIHQLIQPAVIGTNHFATNLALGSWTFVVWSSDGKTSSSSESIDVTPLRRLTVTLTDIASGSNRVIYTGAPLPGPGGFFRAWKETIAIQKP